VGLRCKRISGLRSSSGEFHPIVYSVARLGGAQEQHQACKKELADMHDQSVAKSIRCRAGSGDLEPAQMTRPVSAPDRPRRARGRGQTLAVVQTQRAITLSRRLSSGFMALVAAAGTGLRRSRSGSSGRKFRVVGPIRILSGWRPHEGRCSLG